MLGTRNSRDTLLFGHEFRGELLGGNDLFSGTVTDDGRYLVVRDLPRRSGRREDIVFRDLTKPDCALRRAGLGAGLAVSRHLRQGRMVCEDRLQVAQWQHSEGRSRGHARRLDHHRARSQGLIDTWSIVGGKLYVNRLADVKTETRVYTLDGKPDGTVEYEGIGSASAVLGRSTDRYGFFSFTSFIRPRTIYRLDTVTGKRDVFFQPKVPFDSSQYELKQVIYTSKDGTRVPMFIAGKKGLKQDGTERLLMTGYGGFNLSSLPAWNPQYAWWMEQGGWFALPNLRGGGEYGESWHEQAMFEKKQNVFDDWFAAAEYLIAQHYTSPQHFAITGRSNGGLLMGASFTQRPELFSAVLCGYPLLDMLRYQKFKVGRYWITEYGSADDEKQFTYLFKYSPYQNVKDGTNYPAVMFFTGRQRHPRRSAARAQDDGAAAGRVDERAAHPAALQPGRGPLRRRQRGPAGAGRRRPAFVSLDGNGTTESAPGSSIDSGPSLHFRVEHPHCARSHGEAVRVIRRFDLA